MISPLPKPPCPFPPKPLPGPKSKRLPKGKPLTIAASFQIADGIVFCADRMMSYEQSAYYELKLFNARGSNFSAVAVAASDDMITAKSVIRGFFDGVVGGHTNFHAENLQNALEGCLKVKLESVQDPNMFLIMAFMRDEGDYYVLSSHNTSVNQASPCEIVGIGDVSLVRYITDSLYRVGLTLKQGVALAAYVIWAAKKYCPMYCGGDTDIWVLSKSTPQSSALWRIIPQAAIRRAEELIESHRKEHLENFLSFICRSIEFFT